MEKEKELIFVYNIDLGFFSQIKRFLRKILRPKICDCKLHKLTYSTFLIKKEWQEFIVSLPFKLKFLYRNEFSKNYPEYRKLKLPVILFRGGEVVGPLITKDVLDRIGGLEDLILELNKKLLK
ncbi:hypothetical protein K8R32_02295 [bacterium]|nr:hypothetical protein [bacterium]